MKLKVSIINETDVYEVNMTDGRTLQDIFEDITDMSTTFILLGKRIIQKSMIQEISAE